MPLLVLSFVLLAGSRVDAQTSPRAETPARAPTLRDLPALTAKLSSANRDEVLGAVDQLAILDRPEVVAPLSNLLRQGAPDSITDRGIDALGQLGYPQAIDVLVEFTKHRRPGARLKAYRALSSIQDSRTPTLVAQGLRDSDRSVRGACAIALGDMGARGELETLFLAFQRGVVEAAIAIGKLGDAASIDRFSAELGRQPLATMLSGYDQYLKRRDLNVETKLRLVDRLGEIAGPMVRRFLQDYLATFPERDRSNLKKRVEETIRRIPEGERGVDLQTGAAPSGAPASPAPPTAPAPGPSEANPATPAAAPGAQP